MIHFEIPWNPNRLEQRNGRIDRHGQRSKRVLIHHFVGKGYNDRERNSEETKVGDLEADLEFLMRAVRKVEAIREDIGKVGPVIAEQVEEAMLGLRARLDTRKAETEVEPIRKLLKFEWDLPRLRPGRAGAVRAESRCSPSPADGDPRGNPERDRGDPGTVCRPPAPDVSGGGDVFGAQQAKMKDRSLERFSLG
jgi:hypothetical protein